MLIVDSFTANTSQHAACNQALIWLGAAARRLKQSCDSRSEPVRRLSVDEQHNNGQYPERVFRVTCRRVT